MTSLPIARHWNKNHLNKNTFSILFSNKFFYFKISLFFIKKAVYILIWYASPPVIFSSSQLIVKKKIQQNFHQKRLNCNCCFLKKKKKFPKQKNGKSNKTKTLHGGDVSMFSFPSYKLFYISNGRVRYESVKLKRRHIPKLTISSVIWTKFNIYFKFTWNLFFSRIYVMHSIP